MGLKDNFNQAFRELLKRGGLGRSKDQKEESIQFASYLETQWEAAEQKVAEPMKKSSAAATNPVSEEKSVPPPPKKTAPNNNPAGIRPASRQNPVDEFLHDFKEEMTVISKNTMIIGNIRSFANVTIEGNVRGKIDTLNDVVMRGQVVGDMTCKNAEFTGSSAQGNLITKGSVYLDNDSILLGDMRANNAVIDGKVKGNLEIAGRVEFGASSIVSGDINTDSIIVAEGANIRGFVNTAYLMEHGDSAFPNQITIAGDEEE